MADITQAAVAAATEVLCRLNGMFHAEATMAKSLKAQIESAKKVLAGQTSMVFLEAAMGRDTPFRECLARVGVSTVEGYEYAKKRLEDLELAAVTMGKAYRGSVGQLIWC